MQLDITRLFLTLHYTAKLQKDASMPISTACAPDSHDMPGEESPSALSALFFLSAVKLESKVASAPFVPLGHLVTLLKCVSLLFVEAGSEDKGAGID